MANVLVGVLLKALLKAFTSACQAPAPSQVLIPKGDFKLGEIAMTGPCKSPVEFTLQGNVKADGGSTQGKDRWVVFEKINGFKLNGGGTFDGEGNAAWKANNCHKTFECKKLPIVSVFVLIRYRHLFSKIIYIYIYALSGFK